MNIRRVTMTGTLLGVAFVFGALSPAVAADNVQMSPVRAVPMAEVSGEPWSTPAYPVECQTANGQVSCTPDDPSTVTEQQCFMDVLYEGTGTTIHEAMRSCTWP